MRHLRSSCALVLSLVSGCIDRPAEVPMILSISPSSGPADRANSLVITCAGLPASDLPPHVFLDGAELVTVTVDGATLKGTLPADALPPGPHDLHLVTTSIDARRAGAFTVTEPLITAPRVILLSPADGSSVEASTTVRVQIEARSTVARIAGISLHSTGVIPFDRQLQISPPIAAITTNYTFDIPAGASDEDFVTLTATAFDDQVPPENSASHPVTLHVKRYVGPPVVMAVATNHGPECGGTIVTITGDNFVGVTSVRFGDLEAGLLGVDSVHSLRAVVPPGSGITDVTVVAASAAGTKSGAWRYSPTARVSFTAALPLALVADGSSTSMLIMHVSDLDGDPVRGQQLALATESGTASAVIDRGDGTYVATLTAPSLVGTGSDRVLVSDPAATNQPSDWITLRLIPGAAASLMFVGLQPASIPADGASQSLATVFVNDVNGNPVTDAAVTIRASGQASTSVVANLGDGRYRATITAPPVVPFGGKVAVVATANNLSATNLLSFTCGPAQVFIEDAPGGQGQQIAMQTITAGGLLAVHAVARDAGGTFCGDALAKWTVAGQIGTVDPGPAMSATFTATTTGIGAVLASASGFADGTSAPITVTPGALQKFVAGNINSAQVGQAVPLGMTAIDGWSNVVTSYTGTVALADSSGRMTPTVSPRFVAGQLTVRLVFGQALMKNVVTLSDGAGHGASTLPFDVTWNYTLAAIAPATGELTGGTQVTLSGSGFAQGDVATIDGRALLNQQLMGQAITGQTPPGAAPGVVDVAVVRGGPPVVLSSAFTYSKISTVTLSYDPRTWADTTLRSSPAEMDWNFGIEPTLGVGSLDALVAFGRDRSLLSIDLAAALPPNSRVIDARLSLYATPVGWSRLVPLIVNPPNGMSGAWPAGVPVSATFDHQAAVAAGYSMASGDDVHVLYNSAGNWSEVERAADVGASWNQANTRLWFQLQQAIAKNGSDAGYAIGYGAAAAAPHLNSGAAFPPSVDASTSADFPCEERGGPTLADASPNGNDATLVGFQNSPFGAGYLSGGLACDGAGYAVSNAPPPAGDFSLETWFKTRKASTGLVGYIQSPPAGGAHPLSLSLIGGKLVGEVQMTVTPAMVSFAPPNGGGPGPGPGFNDDKWHHAAMSLTGSTLSLYADGVLVAVAQGQGAMNLGPIGGLVLGSGGGQALLVGSLDGVRLRNGATGSFPWARTVGNAMPGAPITNNVTRAIGAFRMLQTWTQGLGAPANNLPAPGPANWHLGRQNQPWNAPGAGAASDGAGDNGAADRALTPLGVTAIDSPGASYDFDITLAATQWASGGWAQNGIMLAPLYESPDFSRAAFGSGEAVDPTQRPRLTVRYAPAGQANPISVTVTCDVATTISAAAPNLHVAAPASLEVGVAAQPNTATRTILRASLGGVIPPGKVIVSAQLIMMRTADVTGTGSFIAARALARAFDANLVSWTRAAADPWKAAGAGADGIDRVATPESTIWLEPGTVELVSWNVVRLVQAWLDDPAADFGILLGQLDESTPGGSTFAGTPTGTPPVLQIRYLP